LEQPKELLEFLQGRRNSLRVFKSGPGSQALLAQSLLAQGKSVVLVSAGAREHRELAALLRLFLECGRRPGQEPDAEAPPWERSWTELPPYLPKRPEAQEWAERWAALFALAYGPRPRAVLLSADNLLPRWPQPELLRANTLTLTRGEELSPELIREQAALWGYAARPLVSAPGEMAARGDILDIFAPGYGLPLRLEFFGDTLEGLRLFDPASQRSRADLAEAVLLPVAPGLYTGEHGAAAKAWWRKLKTTGEMGPAEEQALLESAERADGQVWPGLFWPNAVGLEAHLPPDAVWILASATDLRARLEEHVFAWREFLRREQESTGRRWPVQFLLRPEESARQAFRDKRQLVFEDLTLGRDREGAELSERGLNAFADLFWKPEDQRRPWTALTTALRDWSRSRRQTVLSFRSERSRRKFLTLAAQEELALSTEYSPDARGLFALVSPLKKGFDLSWAGLLVLAEDLLQPEPAAETRRVSRDKPFEGLERYEDLLEGDLLVHRDYGLARFGGLHRFSVGEAANNDYLLLFFDKDDRLYLPVDRLNLVQRYKGPEGVVPSLDKLGGARWRSTTERARKAVEQIAAELVEMYAFRRVAKGFRYGPPAELYWEFETTFGFEETPDQARAVQDVFADMERPEPMDRLVCGDVGFGKTEVALRAAFRAVLEGRQVALLCPTTVLAEQHYQTFLKRMESFPVRVAMLSRFVSKERQKAVVAATARGEVDILIGTHRLLSQDVAFPRLGLLILDEEQRFGVKHKEKLKHFRKNIDVLTLTATPIPRTLQLSLSGLRGLSVIETPPPERKAVDTALIERDDAFLRRVLEQELARGGQIFWVYNRVQGLERVVEYVKSLAPQARVGMAHGQMSEKGLEEAMHGFWHGELDILVTTAIIESGLDFPNANTLVVDQAQMFGLGQLYQLRGRVGRSERQAFAFFIVPSVEALPEQSRRRLRIILDMDYLGAGFKVALEDLRLRGAGNILGESQSGQIGRVGLDLFLEMLEEEVRRLRGESRRQVTDPELTFVFAAHIPGDYMQDSRERLGYYKALSSANTENALKDLEAELRDRFGPLPEALENFLAVLHLKRTLSRLQVIRAELTPTRAVLSFGPDTDAVKPQDLVNWVSARPGQARLLPPGKLEVRLSETGRITENMAALNRELDGLLGRAAGPATEATS
jgi:transcription-repair coupling factor (superfamily II helicase)